MWGQLVMIIITVCCHLVQINELVVICLHHELRLLTELGDPEVAHDLLVAEVVVGVHEITLYQTCEQCLAIFNIVGSFYNTRNRC